jgi:hypothetical protein
MPLSFPALILVLVLVLVMAVGEYLFITIAAWFIGILVPLIIAYNLGVPDILSPPVFIGLGAIGLIVAPIYGAWRQLKREEQREQRRWQ